jgi:hypothetical protein
MQQEVVNVAQAVAERVEQIRDGYKQPDDALQTPRAK